MANIVGVLLIPIVFGWLGKMVTEDGSTIHNIGEKTVLLAMFHGWLYMIFLVFAAILARKAKWSMPFTITTLLAGTVPFVSFWAEHRATKAVRAQMAETLH